MPTISDLGTKVWYAESGNVGAPYDMDWRSALIAYINNAETGNVALTVLNWDGNTYGVSADYSATPTLGCWSRIEDVTF